MARDDKVLLFGQLPVVTEGFVERWRRTAISRELRENNFEHDIQFRPAMGMNTPATIDGSMSGRSS